jgi:hypothetical protein
MSPRKPTTPEDGVIQFGDVTIEVIEVDPALAQDWLDKCNINNRKLRDGRTAAYARDMAAGQWDFNGDAVRFSVDNVLLDGQHRLEAIVESGTTQPLLVVDQLPAAAQDTMDAGAARTLADVLGLRGEEQAAMLAPVVRRLTLFERAITGGGNWQPTKREMLEFVERHPGVRRAAEVSYLAKHARLPIASSVVGAAYFLCAQRDHGAAEEFFVEKLINSIGMDEGEPVLTLQRRLKTENAAGRQIDIEHGFRYVILAWNRFREGNKPLQKLQKPKGGWKPYSEMVIK